MISDRPFSLPSDPPSGATSHIRKVTQGRRKKQKSLRDQGFYFCTPVVTAASIDFVWHRPELQMCDNNRQHAPRQRPT
jgi:hypothetical protein